MIAALVGFSLFGVSNPAFAQHGHHGGFHSAPAHHGHGSSGGYYGGHRAGYGGSGYYGHGHNAHHVPYGGYGGYGGYSRPYYNHGGLQILTPGFGLSVGGHHHH